MPDDVTVSHPVSLTVPAEETTGRHPLVMRTLLGELTAEGVDLKLFKSLSGYALIVQGQVDGRERRFVIKFEEIMTAVVFQCHLPHHPPEIPHVAPPAVGP
jgi:hypothetical protein